MRPTLVFISDEYPIDDSVTVPGGAGVHLCMIAQSIASEVQVHTISPSSDHSTQTTVNSSTKITHHVISRKYYQKHWWSLSIGKILSSCCLLFGLIRLREVLLWNLSSSLFFDELEKKEDVSAVVVTESNASGLFISTFKKVKFVTLVVGWTTLIWNRGKEKKLSVDNMFTGYLEWWLTKKSSIVFTTSKLMLPLTKAWSRREDVFILPILLKNPEIKPQQTKGETLSVSFFGRFEYRKGPDILLKAGDLLNNTHLILNFFGHDELSYFPEISEDESYFSTLATQISKQSKTKIVVSPALPLHKVKGAILNTDVIVIPSRFEPLSLVVLEAISLGKVVITTTQTGAASLLTHQKNGYIIEPNVEALAQALHSMLKNKKLLPSIDAERKKLITYYTNTNFNHQFLNRVLELPTNVATSPK